MKQKAAAMLALTLAALSGCAAAPAQSQASSAASQAQSELLVASGQLTQYPQPDGKKYHWLPAPELQDAEVIGRVYASRPRREGDVSGAVLGDGLYLAQKDGKYGLVDVSGSWLLPAGYASIRYGYDSYALVADFAAQDYVETFSGNGEIESKPWPQVMGTSNDPTCAWDADAQCLISYGGGGDALVNDRDYQFAGTVRVNACSVQEQGGDYWAGFFDENTPYAVVTDGQLVTDFVYEKAGCFSDGLIAVRQNGKWGYLNAAGQQVIPCEYDAIRSDDPARPEELEALRSAYGWSEEDVQSGLAEWEDERLPACCTGGYVALCRDGAWSLANDRGETVIPEGEFECLTEVTGGVLLAKQAGVWGRVTIG